MRLMNEITEPIRPIPQRRVIEKMNEYMSRRDYAGAERHLLYWLAEAQLGRDPDGMLVLRNEMVGHYRKTGQKDKAMESAEEALSLLAELGISDAIVAGTTYVNIATACNAFGEYERSLELFEKARAVYEGSEYVEPQLLGGLYNNMALTCAALGRYEEALELYEGENRIFELVERAQELLENKGREILGPGWPLTDDVENEPADTDGADMPAVSGGDNATADKDGAGSALRGKSREERARIGYFAFVCEKCAPTFDHYGYFLAAEALKETAERIYREA